METGMSSEKDIRSLRDRGDTAGAAAAALRLYGPEVYGFLVGVLRNEGDAEDVFSIFSERLWRTLSSFEWGCSLRTWCYVLARNEAHRFGRGERGQRAREVPLSAAEEIAAHVRTETLPFLRTEARQELEQLRDSLAPEDRALLILRLDRKLPWQDLALTFAERPLVPGEREREAARLRKRFQLIKERLLRLARERGLVGHAQS